MNPVHALRRILNKQTTAVEQATVVAVKDGQVVVRTSSGVRTVKAIGDTYRVGDTVRLQNNVVLGKAMSQDSIPVFRV